MIPDFEHTQELHCPAGPLLLRGYHLVPDDDGTLHPTSRPVSAVCQCGKSGIQPWCDGTHKLVATARKRATRIAGSTSGDAEGERRITTRRLGD